ncbi:hypothetical protein FG379_002957 [Cryptosporidium bovis]|uniref:uncharacterized protein n=1 Tax=Cryptosporidium bovis TaxID=310047 RepID=UPI00351A61D3|nr:hypothetical protein FG379_002957 [Cryptosporidium bovis]
MRYLNIILLFILSFTLIYNNKEITNTDKIKNASFLRAIGGDGDEINDSDDSNSTNGNVNVDSSSINSLSNESNDNSLTKEDENSTDESSGDGNAGNGGFKNMLGSFLNKFSSDSQLYKKHGKNDRPSANDDENYSKGKKPKDRKKNRNLLDFFKFGGKGRTKDGDLKQGISKGYIEAKSPDTLSTSDTESLNSFNEETNYNVLLNIPDDVSTKGQYDVQLMNMYLESQSKSSEIDVKKSEGIIQNNKSSYKTIKSIFNELYDGEICSEELISLVLHVSVQLLLSKSYCRIAQNKMEGESTHCRKKCRVIKTRSCKLCQETFLKKDKCQRLTKKADGMLERLLKIILECSIRLEVSKKTKLYRRFRDVTPLKCSQEDLNVIKGKLESKILTIVMYVLNMRNLNKLKVTCDLCKYSECFNCKSISSCPKCPGLDDISSCSTCQVTQTLISESIIKRNKEIDDIRKLTRRLESCESYLASKKGFGTKTERHTELDVSSHINEKVRGWLVTLSLTTSDIDTHESESEKDMIKKKALELRTLPDDMKKAIVSGEVKLRSPKPQQEQRRDPESTQLSEVYTKITKGDYGKRHRKDDTPTDKEKVIAILLFESGICTVLMKRMLEEQIKMINSRINELNSSHTGCENCLLDGCRKKRCPNIPNISSLIKKRNEISSKLTICNGMGYASKSELDAKMKEIVDSGILTNENVNSVLQSVQTATTPEEHSEDELVTYTTRL